MYNQYICYSQFMDFIIIDLLRPWSLLKFRIMYMLHHMLSYSTGIGFDIAQIRLEKVFC